MTADIAILAVLAVLAVLALWLLRRDARTEGMRDLLMYGDIEPNREKLPFYVQMVKANGACDCGGVLIREDVVLTAAHCIDYAELDSFYCTIGDDNSGDPIQQRFFTRAKILGKYYSGSRDNNPNYDGDLALLFLDKAVDDAKIAKLWKTSALGVDLKRFKAVGRGWTVDTGNIEKYDSTSKQTALELEGDGWNWNKQVHFDVIIPLKLMTYRSPPIRIEPGKRLLKRQIAVTFRQGGLAKGDSGSPLLIEDNGEWFVAGVVSGRHSLETLPWVTVDGTSSGTYADSTINYQPVFEYRDEIYQQMKIYDDTKKTASKVDEESLTIHEIAHVVALTRLKQLKAIAAANATDFDKLFLPGQGDTKKRWLDLADYFNENGERYSALASAREAQLAVLWALVSNYDNFQVLHDMVSVNPKTPKTPKLDKYGFPDSDSDSDDEVDEEVDDDETVSRIPYFLRLGYSSTSSGLASAKHGDLKKEAPEAHFVSRHGVLQTFKRARVGSDAAWGADGSPLHWKPTEKERDPKNKDVAAPEEKARESEHRAKRKDGFMYLEERFLRRRMYCDFLDTLREYLKTRPAWYKKYLQYNNISSPSRTHGLLECIGYEETLYYDASGKPLSSYNISKPAFNACPAGTTAFSFHPTLDSGQFLRAFVQTRINPQPPGFQQDPSRAWLQVSGDHWPELTATTLYDRYEWIDMPDVKRKITFREAMFLVLDNARLDVPWGIRGANPITLASRRDSKHKPTNEILRYNCPVLLYLYQATAAKLASDVGRDLMRRFIGQERVRNVFRSMPDWNPYDVYDDVIATIGISSYIPKQVAGKIAEFLGQNEKNERKIDYNLFSHLSLLNNQSADPEENEEYQNEYTSFQNFYNHVSWARVNSSYVVNYVVDDDAGREDFDTLSIRPIGKKLNPRFLNALPECTPRTSQPPAPPPPPSIRRSEEQGKQAKEVIEQIASQLKVLGPCPN
jgi:V8-like Glu-specific endopeptidase